MGGPAPANANVQRALMALRELRRLRRAKMVSYHTYQFAALEYGAEFKLRIARLVRNVLQLLALSTFAKPAAAALVDGAESGDGAASASTAAGAVARVASGVRQTVRREGAEESDDSDSESSDSDSSDSEDDDASGYTSSRSTTAKKQKKLTKKSFLKKELASIRLQMASLLSSMSTDAPSAAAATGLTIAPVAAPAALDGVVTPRNSALGRLARQQIPTSSRFESPGLASPCLNSPLEAAMSPHVAPGACSRAVAARAATPRAAVAAAAASRTKMALAAAAANTARAAAAPRPTLFNPNYAESSSDESGSGESDDDDASSAAEEKVAPRKQAPLRIATQAKKSSGHPIFGSSGAGHSARKPLRLRPVERTATGTPINMRKKRCVPSACAAAARFPPPASALDRLALSAAQRAHPHLRT